MRLPAVLMRGGTSKALFFHQRDLPPDPDARDAVLLGVFGSPDPDRRQLDGLGGATSSTSKVAIIGPRSRPDVDVTYEFGQVGIDVPHIGRRANCGNISAAVGPFAVDEGLVAAVEPITTVRFLNTNTDKVIVAHVPTRDGAFDPYGTFAIPGVPTTGSPIRLDFLDPGGAVTGAVLPTGRVRDEVNVAGIGAVAISIVDAANPVVFVPWEALQLDGTETPAELDAHPTALARIEEIRVQASVLAGIAGDVAAARASPTAPMVALVGPARDYQRGDGTPIERSAHTVRMTMISNGRAHGTCPMTGAICTAVAAAIPGTVVADAHTESGDTDDPCRIGHPAGVLTVSAEPECSADIWTVRQVSVVRTARRLFEGVVFAPQHAGALARSDW